MKRVNENPKKSLSQYPVLKVPPLSLPFGDRAAALHCRAARVSILRTAGIGVKRKLQLFLKNFDLQPFPWEFPAAISTFSQFKEMRATLPPFPALF